MAGPTMTSTGERMRDMRWLGLGACVVLWLLLSLALLAWADAGSAWWDQLAPLAPMVLGVLLFGGWTRGR